MLQCSIKVSISVNVIYQNSLRKHLRKQSIGKPLGNWCRFIARVIFLQKHRVVIPETQVNRAKARMSIAYFMHPDDDCLIKCIDGSNKYEPITSLDYLNMRFQATYAK